MACQTTYSFISARPNFPYDKKIFPLKSINHFNTANIFPFLSSQQSQLRIKLRKKACSTDNPMNPENLRPHVVIFPLPLQGPVNSMFKLAELLCLADFQITYVVTDFIYSRLMRYSDIHSRFERYPGFQIKTISDGLPEDHPRSGDQFMELFTSLNTNTKPLFKDLLSSISPVRCIIADGIMGFTCDVANEVGIPIIYVRTISSCCLWVFFCLPKLIESGELPFKDDDLDTLISSVPGTESFLRRRDLPSFCRLGDLSNISVQLYKTEAQENARAFGLILNTFEELEGSILDEMRTVCPNLYTIGPLHALLASKTMSEANSSSSLWEEDKSCITWLDKQPIKSVIYVSFGSIATLKNDELMEFWYGLVNSGVRFLWVIRPDSIAGKDWEKNIPAELSEGTKERGYTVGWAPQEQVLRHPSVGGFWTHNGWNSTLESVFEGVPMICWPYFMDQQVNSRFVEAFWKLGLDMKDTCDRNIVAKTIRELMVERKEYFLDRAEKMALLAKGCLREGGSSYGNLQRMINDIKSMTPNDSGKI